MRLLITRPKEDAAPLIEILKAQGHDPVLFPLLEISFDQEDAKRLSSFKIKDVQALLVTSANGVRAFAQADKRRSFNVLAVGDASARAARDVGFKSVESADGDVETLAALIKKTCDPKKGTFLHIAGSKVAGDLAGLLEADGFAYERVVLYSAEKITDFSAELKNQIKTGRIDGVLLYSPRTAVSFVQLLEKSNLKNCAKSMVAYGLSAAVASKLTGVPFQEVKTAITPDQKALLACLPQSKDEAMTVKKEENKKEDPKVIDAKAEEVKTKDVSKDAPKADAKKEADKKTASKTPAVKKADPKKADPKKPVAKKADEAKKPADAKKTDGPVEKALNEKPAEKPKKKGSFKAKLMVASVIIIAGVGVGGYYTQDVWIPKAKAKIVEVLKLDEVMNTGASAEELAALISRLEALESKPAPAPVDVQPLLDKIAELEGALKSVKSEVSSIEIASSSSGSADMGEIKELVSLKENNDALSQQVSTLMDRLAKVEDTGFQVQAMGSNVQGLIAALSSLREVVRTSSSFEAELKTLAALSQQDQALLDGVAALQPNAAKGLASTSALITAFEKTADDIVRAVAVPEGAGWMEQTVKNVTSLVTIRRAPGNIEGDGTLGIVARAEMNVRNGDFAGAIKELETLEGNPKEAAQGWIAQASARLGAEKTLSQMQAHALSLLTGSGGQG